MGEDMLFCKKKKIRRNVVNTIQSNNPYVLHALYFLCVDFFTFLKICQYTYRFFVEMDYDDDDDVVIVANYKKVYINFNDDCNGM